MGKFLMVILSLGLALNSHAFSQNNSSEDRSFLSIPICTTFKFTQDKVWITNEPSLNVVDAGGAKITALRYNEEIFNYDEVIPRGSEYYLYTYKTYDQVELRKKGDFSTYLLLNISCENESGKNCTFEEFKTKISSVLSIGKLSRDNRDCKRLK
ncbi:MAG: hypothetical protein ACXVB4_02120 [Pseudobdellovibrionaceae bacterium]